MYTTLCISSLLRNETFCCCSTLWFSCLKLWFCIFSDQVYPTNYCAQMRPFYLIEAIQTNRMELNEQGEIFAVECIWTKLSSSILDAYLMQSTSISHFSLHAFFLKKKKLFSFLLASLVFLMKWFSSIFSINHSLKPIQSDRYANEKKKYYGFVARNFHADWAQPVRHVHSQYE